MPATALTKPKSPSSSTKSFVGNGGRWLPRIIAPHSSTSTDNGRWALPGGAIEIGETADQGGVREVQEETGYRVQVLRLIGVYSDPAHTTITYPNGDVSAYVAIAFECRVTGGAPALSDETAAVDWFDTTALPQNFHPGHQPRLNDALAKQTAAFYR